MLALSGAESSAARAPEYIRVQISSNAIAYVKFQEGEMRVATTARGLAAAEPVKATESSRELVDRRQVYYFHEFPEVDLPFAAEELPNGFAEARMQLNYQYTESRGIRRSARDGFSHVWGKVGLRREDAAGAVWTYWVRAGSESGRIATRAPVVAVPDMGRLALQIETKVEKGRKVGIAVLVKSGSAQLTDVTRNGKSQQAELQVSTKDGKVVETKRATLSDLGYT